MTSETVMINEYPKWIEPNPAYNLFRNAIGEMEHPTGLPFHVDRASNKITVLVPNAQEAKRVMDPPPADAQAHANDAVNVSIEHVVADIKKMREGLLVGSELERLADKMAKLGSLDRHEQILRMHERELQEAAKQLAKTRDEMAAFVVQKTREVRDEASKLLSDAQQKAKQIVSGAETQKQRIADEIATLSDLRDQAKNELALVGKDIAEKKKISAAIKATIERFQSSL
jgi:hypothetical protein